MWVIVDYDKLYMPRDKHRHSLVHADYVKLPVKPKGEGLQTLLRYKDGLRVFGIWCLLLEKTTAQKCDLRGKLLNHRDEPATISEIAFGISLPKKLKLVEYALSLLKTMGWVTEQVENPALLRTTSQGAQKRDKQCSVVECSEVKCSDNNKGVVVREVFDFWNKQKEKWPKWKTHRLVNGGVPPNIKDVLVVVLKKWPVAAVKGAIENFAWVFGSNESKWTHGWTLVELFTRHIKGTEPPQLQWETRFAPSNFSQDDYLTLEAKQKRTTSARTAFQRQEDKSYTPATPEEKQQVRLNLPQFKGVRTVKLTPEQRAEQVRKQKEALGAKQ